MLPQIYVFHELNPVGRASIGVQQGDGLPERVWQSVHIGVQQGQKAFLGTGPLILREVQRAERVPERRAALRRGRHFTRAVRPLDQGVQARDERQGTPLPVMDYIQAGTQEHALQPRHALTGRVVTQRAAQAGQLARSSCERFSTSVQTAWQSVWRSS